MPWNAKTNPVLTHPSVLEAAALAGATPAQAVLRWVLSRGPHMVVVPRTRQRGNMEENLQALAVDGTKLKALDRLDGTDPLRHLLAEREL